MILLKNRTKPTKEIETASITIDCDIIKLCVKRFKGTDIFSTSISVFGQTMTQIDDLNGTFKVVLLRSLKLIHTETY